MTTVQMRQFGSTLTDRADGKKVFEAIRRTSAFPVELDFSDVVSLGSSFGDEVVLAIAGMQLNEITVRHANHIIQNSIRRSIEDTLVTVSFKDDQ